MTGSPIQTGFRHICRPEPTTSQTRKKDVVEFADRSKQCNRVGSQCQFHEGKNRPNLKRMYFSDDSEPFETTDSQDERIEQQLQQEKEEERSRQNLLESERKEAFEEVFREKDHEIFNLPGLTFLKFTHIKIKFCFEPCKVVTNVSKNVKFYCTLKYYEKYNVWNIRRDSFPVNFKWRIYRIFYRGEYFAVTDETVAGTIFRIYVQLKLWAQEEEEYRTEKFMKYQNGECVFLDSDDEELFFNEDQRKEFHDKRMKVLRRMIPPPDAKLQVLPPEPTRKKRQRSPHAERTKKTRRRQQLIISDSD